MLPTHQCQANHKTDDAPSIAKNFCQLYKLMFTLGTYHLHTMNTVYYLLRYRSTTTHISYTTAKRSTDLFRLD